MATLSKHGEQLAVVERLTSKVAYMSDGKILRNQGNGWKMYRRVRPGVDPVEHAKQAQANYAKLLEERPALAAYRKALHAVASNGSRWLVNETLNMLANDPDGVWSELNDHANIAIGVDECSELCRLHEAASAETKRHRAISASATDRDETHAVYAGSGKDIAIVYDGDDALRQQLDAALDELRKRTEERDEANRCIALLEAQINSMA